LELIRSQAMNMLARRALTRRELKQKLMVKGALAEEAGEVVRNLVEDGLLNEANLAEDAVRITSQKLVSRRFIAQKLRSRGLAEDLVEAEIGRQVDGDAEYQAALHFAEKKLRMLEGVAVEVKRRRIGGALDRRGFPSSVIIRVLEELQMGD
jgi:regulatory protein